MNVLQAQVFGIPIWMIGLVAVGGVVVFLIIRNRTSSSSTGALGQNTSTAAPDPNIDPLTGVPYSIEGATNPATGLPAYYGGPGTNGSPSTTTAMVRAQNTTGPVGQYDTANPQGVPLDTTPGQLGSAGYVPYGAQVQITGPAVQGPPNAPQIGVTSWYPASYNSESGFISAYDVTLAPNTGTGTGHPRGPYQATHWWPQALDMQAYGRGGR